MKDVLASHGGNHGIAGKELMTEESIEHMASVVEAQGTDAFWQAPVEELLPAALRGEAPRLEKRLETMDVWFDSGTSWAGCVETTEGLSFPADLYLEASTSLTSCPCAASSSPGALVSSQRRRRVEPHHQPSSARRKADPDAVRTGHIHIEQIYMESPLQMMRAGQ